jgi:hypothetical protein
VRKVEVLAGALCAVLIYGPFKAATADEGEFIGYMTRMQYFTHKLALSIEVGSQELQEFYAHEVEEQIEGALEVESLDEIPVAKLMREFLVPKFEALEAAVKSGDAEKVNADFDALIEGCNRCHSAAQRSYIYIERRTDSPYMQSFAR